MRRKFLSVVLCVCMMLTMVPFAFAADGETATPSSETAEAATFSKDGTTLNGDNGLATAIVNNATIKLEASGTAALPSTITAKDVVIDLNDNTLTLSNTTSISIANGGSLTFKNGNLVSKLGTTGTGSRFDYGCTANFNIKTNSSITLDNVDVDSNASVLYPQGDAASVNVINGSSIKCGVYAVGTNAYALDNYNVVINLQNSTFTSTYGYKNDADNVGDSCAIMINIPGTLNMDNCTVNGTRQGVVVRGGTATIKNSNINLNANYPTGANKHLSDNWGGGDEVPMAALVVGNRHLESYQYSAYCSLENTNLSATEGYKTAYVYGNNSSDQTATLIYDKASSVGTIVNGNSNTTIIGTPVASIGDKIYTSLESAISAATSNQTVKLLDDVLVPDTINVAKKISIDLNNHTITGQNGDEGRRVFRAIEGGDLTLTGTGTVTTASGHSNSFPAESAVLGVDSNWETPGSAALTIDSNVTVIAPDSYGITLFGNGDPAKKASLVVKGTVLVKSDAAAISNNGTNGNTDYGQTSITIENGAQVTSQNGLAIYHPGKGTLTIKEATLTGSGGVEVKSGDTTISVDGATINATSTPVHDPSDTGSSTSGYAIAVVENNAYTGAANVTISAGNYTGPIAILKDSDVTDSTKAGQISISGGYFTSDPTPYLATGHYAVTSEKNGYSYKVTGSKPDDTQVIVADNTKVEVSNTVPDSVKKVITKANVDGVAEAITDSAKDSILKDAQVTDLTNKDTTIIIDIGVTVKATGAESTTENAISSLTFEATPTATVKTINGNTNTAKTGIAVSNNYLSGQAITVKLPLPIDFTPKQIKHTSNDGNVEYFLDHYERGAKTFSIDDNHCAVFTITKFSTFVVSGTQDYVAPSHSSSGSASTTYNVTVNAATNGTVAADKKTAAKGATVTITATPSAGYVVDAVKVVDKDGKDVAVTEKDGKYVFTMPASAVTVTGSFKAETPAPAALPFTDVKSGNWFYDAVKYAYAQGLMTGTSATTFAPNGTMNRAMIVTVLYRLEKSPAVTGASKFTDVPAGQWYSDAVAWAAANKIVNGYDETTFGPMNAVTREQMAAILFRYEQVKGLENVTLEENLNRFPDQNKISAYAIPALQWAVGQKIINGNADGTLDPTGTATRAQVAQIFTNLLNK